MRVSVVSFPMLIGHTTLGILPSRGSGSGGGAVKRGSLGSIKMPSAIGHPSAGGVCSFSACLSVWLRWHLYIYLCKLSVFLLLSLPVISLCFFARYLTIFLCIFITEFEPTNKKCLEQAEGGISDPIRYIYSVSPMSVCLFICMSACFSETVEAAVNKCSNKIRMHCKK